MDDLRTARQNQDIRQVRKSNRSNRPIKKQILAGAGILLLIIFIFVSVGGNGGASKEQLKTLEADLEQFRIRLSQIEEIGREADAFAGQINKIQQTLSKLEKSDRLIREDVNQMGKKIRQFEKQLVSHEKIPRTSAYHRVKPGEYLLKIAKQYDLSLDTLCRLNNINPDETILPGQKLLVQP